jgi:hypothetical protein
MYITHEFNIERGPFYKTLAHVSKCFFGMLANHASNSHVVKLSDVSVQVRKQKQVSKDQEPKLTTQVAKRDST